MVKQDYAHFEVMKNSKYFIVLLVSAAFIAGAVSGCAGAPADTGGGKHIIITTIVTTEDLTERR